MNGEQLGTWSADWAWGLPLIVITVMLHVFVLGFIKRAADRLIHFICQHQVLSIGSITLFITMLHGFEAFLWSIAFQYLKAVPDTHTAMLYSLNALTAFGHVDVKLEKHWQLMGALESLNGWILFGLSTAYLFALIQRVWSRPDSAFQI